MAIFSTTANLLTVGSSIYSFFVDGWNSKAFTELLSDGSDALAEMGDEITRLFETGFSDAMKRDCQAALTLSTEAATSLLNHPHYAQARDIDQIKAGIVRDAATGLTAITLQARTILQGDAEPGAVLAAVNGVIYALSVQTKVAAVLQDGDVTTGAYRQPAMQARIGDAIDVLRQARTAFTESLDINVAFTKHWVQYTANNIGPLAWLMKLISPQSSDGHFYDIDISSKSGIDHWALLREIFGSNVSRKSDGSFRVSDDATATLTYANGVVEYVKMDSPTGMHNVRHYIEERIRAFALEQNGFDSPLDSLIDQYASMLGGAYVVGTADSGAHVGTAFDDYIDGGEGHDVILGLEGRDILVGGAGNDRLYGGAGADRLEGGDGDDMLDGGLGADLAIGGAGNDLYFVDDEADRIVERASEGHDRVISSAYSYTLDAHVEDLTLAGGAVFGVGNAGDNRLTGNTAINVLKGGDGNDTLDGGAGVDFLYGEAGADTFVLRDLASADRIMDFNANEDRIALDSRTFAAVADGVSAENFAYHAARDADDHIIFAHDKLFYDADGSGAGDAVLIATFAIVHNNPFLPNPGSVAGLSWANFDIV